MSSSIAERAEDVVDSGLRAMSDPRSRDVGTRLIIHRHRLLGSCGSFVSTTAFTAVCILDSQQDTRGVQLWGRNAGPTSTDSQDA